MGPVWNGGGADKDDTLTACYANSLKLAAAKGLSSIAFPCISTGIYGFPPERASQIAVETVRHFLKDPSSLQTIIFCCFSDTDRAFYEALLQTHLGKEASR